MRLGTWVAEEILLNGGSMAKKKTMMNEKGSRAMCLRNVNRLLWVSKNIKDRRIVGGDGQQARELAVQAFVRLRRVTGEFMELAPEVFVSPDYRMAENYHSYRLFMNLVIHDSQPMEVKDVELTGDTLILRLRNFTIELPMAMNLTEKETFDRFAWMVENIDPLTPDGEAASNAS